MAGAICPPCDPPGCTRRIAFIAFPTAMEPGSAEQRPRHSSVGGNWKGEGGLFKGDDLPPRLAGGHRRGLIRGASRQARPPSRLSTP